MSVTLSRSGRKAFSVCVLEREKEWQKIFKAKIYKLKSQIVTFLSTLMEEIFAVEEIRYIFAGI